MKQMQSFLSDISDDHKIVVVEAIRSLCFKYPSKHRILISHLQSKRPQFSLEVHAYSVLHKCSKFIARIRLQKTPMTLPPAILRDEGGHDFKRAVVNAILNVIEQVSQTFCAITHICSEHACCFAGVLYSFCFF